MTSLMEQLLIVDYVVQNILLLSLYITVLLYVVVGEKPTDIVMCLGNIFRYISSKTGRIWTKVGKMGNGKRAIL